MPEGANSFTVVKAFLVGAICGAAAALLLAPQSGEETRKKLSEKKDDAMKDEEPLPEEKTGDENDINSDSIGIDYCA